mgnify:CR=1 FL=1
MKTPTILYAMSTSTLSLNCYGTLTIQTKVTPILTTMRTLTNTNIDTILSNHVLFFPSFICE